MSTMAKAEDLEKAGVWPGQVSIFRAEWPGGCEINEESLRRAVALGVNIDWLAPLALQPAGLARFWVELRRVLQVRDAAASQAGLMHEAHRKRIWDTYVVARNQIRKAHKEAHRLVQEACQNNALESLIAIMREEEGHGQETEARTHPDL